MQLTRLGHISQQNHDITTSTSRQHISWSPSQFFLVQEKDALIEAQQHRRQVGCNPGGEPQIIMSFFSG